MVVTIDTGEVPIYWHYLQQALHLIFTTFLYAFQRWILSLQSCTAFTMAKNFFYFLDRLFSFSEFHFTSIGNILLSLISRKLLILLAFCGKHSIRYRIIEFFLLIFAWFISQSICSMDCSLFLATCFSYCSFQIGG